MSNLPTFIAPARFTDPALALEQVARIYDANIGHLRHAMQQFVAGNDALGRVSENGANRVPRPAERTTPHTPMPLTLASSRRSKSDQSRRRTQVGDGH